MADAREQLSSLCANFNERAGVRLFLNAVNPLLSGRVHRAAEIGARP